MLWTLLFADLAVCTLHLPKCQPDYPLVTPCMYKLRRAPLLRYTNFATNFVMLEAEHKTCLQFILKNVEALWLIQRDIQHPLVFVFRVYYVVVILWALPTPMTFIVIKTWISSRIALFQVLLFMSFTEVLYSSKPHTLLLLHLQGLDNEVIVRSMRDYSRRHTFCMDVLCLQECKDKHIRMNLGFGLRHTRVAFCE